MRLRTKNLYNIYMYMYNVALSLKIQRRNEKKKERLATCREAYALLILLYHISYIRRQHGYSIFIFFILPFFIFSFVSFFFFRFLVFFSSPFIFLRTSRFFVKRTYAKCECAYTEQRVEVSSVSTIPT